MGNRLEVQQACELSLYDETQLLRSKDLQRGLGAKFAEVVAHNRLPAA